MTNFKYLMLLLVMAGCVHERTGMEQTQLQLTRKNFVADHTIDDQLAKLIPGLNCIAAKGGSRLYFVTEKDYVPADTNQIQVIAFRTVASQGTPSGFSDLTNRAVFVCPPQITRFVQANSLGSNPEISGYLGIVLLHELGHFISGTSGSFDQISQEPQKQSRLGEQDMNMTPQYITLAKKLELKVDSLAVDMLRKGLVKPSTECLMCATDIQLAINGAEFTLFGNRMLGNFGTLTPMIHDQAQSHPNIELRLAFMNFYINPTLEKRQKIDTYLYEREVAPINRQLTDPRIFQGDQKVLTN